MNILKPLFSSRTIASLGALAAVALSTPLASAQLVETWTGLGTSGSYALAGNWISGTSAGYTPTATTTVVFNLPTGVTQPIIHDDTSGTMMITSATGGWVFGASGGQLTPSGIITIDESLQSSGTDTFNFNLRAHGGNVIFNIGAGGTLLERPAQRGGPQFLHIH